jgi:Fe-S cluster assembly protein SufD
MINGMNFKEKLVAEFSNLKDGQLRSYFGERLLQVKENSFHKFEKVGLPTLKHEEWKYTSLNFLNQIDFSLNNKKYEKAYRSESNFLNHLNGENYNLIHLINGNLANKRIESRNGTVDLIHFAENPLENFDFDLYSIFEKNFIDDSNPFGYLNTAFFSDGFKLVVADNVELPEPIILVFSYDNELPLFTNSLNFIKIGENSKVNLVVVFENPSSGKIFANETINILQEPNSQFEISFVQNNIPSLYLINNINLVQQENTYSKSNTVSLSARFVRNNLNVSFDGEHSEAHLNGIYFVDDDELVDDHTVIQHNKPNCLSNENFRGILDGKSRAVFNGKIFVARNAQKTNAYQSNKNILLSDEARINSKPQLEIYADDVKCTHGATAGYLDREMLFYIESRGISKEKAKSLLLNSFVSENIEQIELPELRDSIKEEIAKKLHLEDIFFCSTIDEITKTF